MLITLSMLWPLLFLPLPWILRILLPPAASTDTGLLRVPFFDAIDELAHRRERNRSSRSWRLRFALFCIWVSLVIAACGPTYIGDPITVHDKARDLMFAVDVSGSMQMTDLTLRGEQVDRLTVIKDVLNEFIDRRNGDRMGLILFGSQAYLQTPLTFDRPTLKQLLYEAQIGIAGPNTAIGDAIGLALKRLKDRPNESKVLILLTDGANTAGEISPIQAAQLAKAKGLKIYTIGVGADEMVMPGLLGTRLGARRINPSADLDAETLTAIAETTGGRYFRAKSTDGLRQIYQLLDKLEPIESDPETFRPIRSLFYYPLGLALALSVVIALRYLLRNLLGRRNLQAREQADLLNEVAP